MTEKSEKQHIRKDPHAPALDFSILQERFDANYPAKLEYGKENSMQIHDDDRLDIKTPLLSDTHIPLAQELRSKVMKHGSQLDTYYQEKSLFAAKMKYYFEQVDIQGLNEQELIAFTQAFSYLDERARHYMGDPIQQLNEVDTQQIELTILGQKKYDRLTKHSSIALTDMQKQQQLKHFLSLMMRETSNTTATLLFTIQQDIKENFSKLIGTEAELIHTIHELGIENRLEKAVTRSGDNLQSEVTKIINSYNAGSELQTLQEIISLIRSQYQGDIYSSGKPLESLTDQATQCVGFTTLGKYLEQLPGTQYLPITIHGHAVSMLYRNNNHYRVDISRNIVLKLENVDIQNFNINKKEFISYYNGTQSESKIYKLPSKILSLYQKKYIKTGELKGILNPNHIEHSNLYLSNKYTSLTGNLLNVMGDKNSMIESGNNHQKAEYYDLQAIKYGCTRILNDIGNLYHDSVKLKNHQYAEYYYLKAIKYTYTLPYSNLGELYADKQSPIYNPAKALYCYQQFINPALGGKDEYPEEYANAEDQIKELIRQGIKPQPISIPEN